MMKNINFLFLFLLVLGMSGSLFAQQELECNPTEGLPVASSEVSINFGSATNAASLTNKSSLTIGQPVIGESRSLSDTCAQYGFWSSSRLPPRSPILTVSQGDFPDRTLLTWKPDPIGSQPTDGFDIFRDGAFLADVSKDIGQFIDFNVQSGEIYEYSIISKNILGSSVPAVEIGFVNPNGVVTGRITTRNGNPVEGCIVTIEPNSGNTSINKAISFNGIDDNLCVSYNNQLPEDAFTVSTWFKVDDYNGGSLIDLGSSINANWWLHTADGTEALIFGIGNAATKTISIANDANDWHHLAAVYNGKTTIFYLDQTYVGAMNGVMDTEASKFNIGSDFDGLSFFDGSLDDTRIYNRTLTQTEIILSNDITASVYTPGLVAYWKYDEGQGKKAFDLTENKIVAVKTDEISFTSDAPEIKNGATTDIDGNYMISGINYSETGNMKVTPAISFYRNYSLEFNAVNESCVVLPDFDIPDTSTIELSVMPFDYDSLQTILSYQGKFHFYIENNMYKLQMGSGVAQNISSPTGLYEHFAFTMDSGTNTLKVYNNGLEVLSTTGFTGGNWSGENWTVGAQQIGSTNGNFYTGLVDEVVFYEKAFVISDIQILASSLLEVDNDTTRNYLFAEYAFNESKGTLLRDFGPMVFADGTNHNATYSIVARVQDTNPHDFSPNSRNVNLNFSSTSVSNVNFTDQSELSITGVVRFANTFCYQDSVEILVNGESHTPQPIYTDSVGRFAASFEPGLDIILTPRYGSDPDTSLHVFSPTFYEVRGFYTPIANLLFQNTTKREISGRIFGGHCEKDIIRTNPDGSIKDTVWVEVNALSGCYSKQYTVTTADGTYEFTDVPPIPVSVGITRFNNIADDIWKYFDPRGGQMTDMEHIQTDTIDFMYQSIPNIEYSPITQNINTCTNSAIVLPYGLYSTTIKIYEDYEGGSCYLDNATIIIKDEIANINYDSTFHMTNGELEYEALAADPNIIAPYTKKLEIRVKTGGTETPIDLVPPIEAIVLGDKPRQDSDSYAFTSVSPPILVDIIRDPPGDASFATREAGSTTCGTIDLSIEGLRVQSGGMEASLLPTYTANIGPPSATLERELEFVATTENTWKRTRGWNKGLVEEVCYENNIAISTSEDSDLIGEQGDVYIGTTFNLKWQITDELRWVNDLCQVALGERLAVDTEGFNSEFQYSHRYIENNLIPDLLLLAENEMDSTKKAEYIASAYEWNLMLLAENERKENKRNNLSSILTLDAGVVYESSMSISETAETSVGYSTAFEFENANSAGFFYNSVGAKLNIGFERSSSGEGSQGLSEGNTTTYSFTLADDDIGDVFAVGVSTADALINPGDNLELSNIDLDKIYYHDCHLGRMEFSNVNACKYSSETLYGVHYPTEGFRKPKLNCDCQEDYSTNNVGGVILNATQGTNSGNSGNYTPGPGEIVNADLSNIIYPDDLLLGEFPAPIFINIAGTTSCPFEGGRRRDKAIFSPDRTKASNIDVNNAAVFKLGLANESPSEETREYKVAVVAGTNLGGALIEIDGFSISSIPYTITIPYLEERNIVMTIRKGDVVGQFDYEDIQIAMYVDCEFNPIDAINGDLDEEIYTVESFEVNFVQPCSSVEIGYPTEGHTVTPGNTNLGITLVDYTEDDPSLDYIAVQYRPIAGGSWINITPTQVDTLFADSLGASSTLVEWEMIDLQDGNYEVRAVAFCHDVSLNPGVSTIIGVQKETEPPSLLGTPEPADGVLVPGDEISITFNEQINCDLADAETTTSGYFLNNIALIDTERDELVNFTGQCVGDKIIIIPLDQASVLDGKILKARVTDIKDLAGNEMSVPINGPGTAGVNYKEWEFLVDLNPLRWIEGSNITEIKIEGAVKMVTRSIINNSGFDMNYEITGPRINNLTGQVTYESIPSWMLVEPKIGTLAAGEVKEITFLFPMDLLVDDYLSEINVVGSQGRNAIEVDLKVRCEGPEWDFNRVHEFQNTMTFTVQADVFGDISMDNSDRIAAFINGELRGSAYIEKVEVFDGVDNNGDGLVNEDDEDGQWMAFLTVYGDETDNPLIDFNFFDGSECLIYADMVGEDPDNPVYYDYIPTAQEGVPQDPTVLYVLNVIDRCIPLAEGWNWISFNLDMMDNSPTNVLDSLSNKDGDFIKDDDEQSAYTAGTWIGNMTEIGYEKRYMYQTLADDILCMTGQPYDPDTATIDIITGWNWIGFVPQQGMTVENALNSLTPVTGDLIKSQTAFAQYYATFGWIGNLNFMQSPEGYLLNAQNSGTIQYDPTLQAKEGEIIEKRSATQPYWNIVSNDFQFNMNMTAIVNPEHYDLTENDQIGVFAGSELRGYGEAIYVEPFDKYMLFITAYGDETAEDLEFVLFSQRDSSLIELHEEITFQADGIIGSGTNPFVFNLASETTTPVFEVEEEFTEEFTVNIYPNPARSKYHLEFNSNMVDEATIELTDQQGRVIERMEVEIPVGQHILQYDAKGLAGGVYNLNIQTSTESIQKKLIKID